MSLDKIFKPKSVAVIGASDRPGSVGFALIDNLLNSDFRGKVYPVNMKRKRIHGKRAYESVSKIEDKVDLAIIATPAVTVPAVVEECGQKGVGGAIIISAGFSEIGKEGERLSQSIADLAKKYKMRIIGPNCLGITRPKNNLNASFASKMALSGKIALISQSGALCTSILDWSHKNNVGFSFFISIGSMVDVGFADLLDYVGNDDDTDAILIYMESLKNADKFLKIARKLVKKKPIFVLKSGRSREGAKAAKSHTGSLSGNDEVFSAGFESAGIIRLDMISELNNIAKFLSAKNRPAGERIAIMTNAGGPGVIATDFLMKNGGVMAEINQKTINELNKFLPPAWSHEDPIDILGDADPARYERAVKVCLDDKNVDSLLIILTPQSMTEPTKVAEAIVKINHSHKKPIYCVWMGGEEVASSEKIFIKNKIPCFSSVEEGVTCLANYSKYLLAKNELSEKSEGLKNNFKPKTEKNKKIIQKLIEEKRNTLTEAESKEFLKNYEIPVTNYDVVNSSAEAGRVAGKLGFPVVMKILSPDILHKTDIGGVVLNIQSKGESQAAYDKIIKAAKKHRKDARIEGVLIEAMVSKKFELIIGTNRDPIFGPVIVFGLGGTAVEVFKDTSIALPPLNLDRVEKMIRRTKIYQLLKGYRGLPGVNIKNLELLLCKFSRLIEDFPEIKELDINPFVIDDKGGVALDAKVIFELE